MSRDGFLTGLQAIRNGLTGSQKIQVFLGTLNLDDIISSDFKRFPQVASQPFSLAFASNGNPASNRYTIDGRLRAVPVVVDPCAAQAARVRDAQDTVNVIEAEIKSLQDQLKGQNPPGEPPLPQGLHHFRDQAHPRRGTGSRRRGAS